VDPDIARERRVGAAGRIDAIAALDQDCNWRMMHELEDLRKFFTSLGREVLPATTGQGEWNKAGLRPQRPAMDPSTLSLFLRSPRNAGLREHNGEIVLDADGNRVKGTWPPLVDVDLRGHPAGHTRGGRALAGAPAYGDRRAVMTITVLPIGKGGHVFDPDRVDVRWK
jgi:hypothetical protein